MDSAHRKMDRISFQPLHWDNRQAATGRFFFLSLSPFSIFTEIKLVIDGGETNRWPPPTAQLQLSYNPPLFLLCVQWMSYVSQLWFDYYYSELFSAEREISVHSLLTFFFFYLFCGYLQSINCGPFHLTSYIQRRPSPIDSCCAPSGRINAPRRRPYVIIRSHLCFNFIRYSFSCVLHRRALFEWNNIFEWPE